MPDIYKRRGLQKLTGSVRIPDVALPPPPAPEDGEEEEPEREEEQEQQQAAARFEPVMPTREELMERCRDELEDIRREAARQAYSEAVNRKRAELEDCMAQVGEILARMQRSQEEFIEQYAEELKYLAVDIAEKIVVKKIEEDDMTLRELVMQTVGRIKNADWLEVELSEELTGLVEHLKEEFRKPEYGGKASVATKHGALDMVRVETPDGAVTATVSAQADLLREAFRNEEIQDR